MCVLVLMSRWRAWLGGLFIVYYTVLCNLISIFLYILIRVFVYKMKKLNCISVTGSIIWYFSIKILREKKVLVLVLATDELPAHSISNWMVSVTQHQNIFCMHPSTFCETSECITKFLSPYVFWFSCDLWPSSQLTQGWPNQSRCPSRLPVTF